MNGIDRIAERIVDEARQEAEALLAEADKKAASLLAEAAAEAKALRESMVAEGEAAADRHYDLLIAAADTEARKSSLRIKQALISEAFGRAVFRLRSLDDSRYVSLLAALAVKASETGAEQIILNAADRAAFGEKIAAEANRLSGKNLTLAEETRPIVGGLILSQGRIEVNCALDTLAALRKNELAGEAAKRLFG